MEKDRLWLQHLLHGFCALLCLALMVGTFRYAADPYDNRIVEGVTVGGLDVGGMTPEEACRTLNAAAARALECTDFTLFLPEETLYLSLGEMDVSFRCLPAVWQAWRVGRGSENARIGLLPYLRLDESYIRRALDSYAKAHDTVCTPSHYTLAGTPPQLETTNAEPPTQTLELTFGLPTARLDQEAAFQKVLAAFDAAFSGSLSAGDFQVDILETPEAPDLQAIYKEIYIAPVDDSIDLEKLEIIPGSWGYHFDLEAAEKLVSSGDWGETVSIPMEFKAPEIFGDDVYFRDVLGYCETKHTADENRNNNLRRACSSMNDLILQPGEVFSYNDTLGPRTKANGYLRAGSYSGWELVQAYGGGICQGSTTIYGAALDADLEIVHRKNHGYMVGYVEPGLDATVNWGGPDFQFRNSTHFPIKIQAEVSDGYVKVTILGTEERDYDIEMESEAQWGNDTIYAKSYKCKYDRETGELISRELEAKSNYMR